MDLSAIYPHFHNDDGSLPDIFIENLSVEEICDSIDVLFSQNGSPQALNGWDDSSKSELQIHIHRFLSDYLNGKHPEITLHRTVLDLMVNNTVIPTLSLEIGSDYIGLDYRKGPEWTDAKLKALLELIRLINKKTAQPIIRLCDEGGKTAHSEFNQVLNAYHSLQDSV